MKTTAHIFAFILFFAFPFLSSGAELYKPFIADQYSRKDFSVSKGQFQHGAVSIMLIEAKRISRTYNESPYICRAWFEVKRGNETTYRRYFDDIDAVGFQYGLMVPSRQPPAPYFAVVKNGDYDGRLILIRNDGKVFDLMGGFYFFSKDKRYLFSIYVTDGEGLEIFDLKDGTIVFSSKTSSLPGEIEQWYEKDGQYFFTVTNDSGLDEKERTVYFYDFKLNKIIEKTNYASEVPLASPISYDFDPSKDENCTATNDKSLDRSGPASRLGRTK